MASWSPLFDEEISLPSLPPRLVRSRPVLAPSPSATSFSVHHRGRLRRLHGIHPRRNRHRRGIHRNRELGGTRRRRLCLASPSAALHRLGRGKSARLDRHRTRRRRVITRAGLHSWDCNQFDRPNSDGWRRSNLACRRRSPSSSLCRRLS